MSVTPASEVEIDAIAAHFGELHAREFQDVRKIIDLDPVAVTAKGTLVPTGGSSPDLAIQMMSNEVKLAMVKAGFAIEGTAEAKIRTIDAYLRAVETAKVLPSKVGRMVAEQNAARAVALVQVAKAEVEASAIQAAGPAHVELAKQRSETDLMVGQAQHGIVAYRLQGETASAEAGANAVIAASMLQNVQARILADKADHKEKAWQAVEPIHEAATITDAMNKAKKRNRRVNRRVLPSDDKGY